MSMSVYDHLEFKHLKSIVAIAEEGTITAAATRIALAQSALSRQINELEELLHIKIFERDHGGMMLTPAGESLLDRRGIAPNPDRYHPSCASDSPGHDATV
jgi:molybdate transport repressor ModE-like protein